MGFFKDLFTNAKFVTGNSTYYVPLKNNPSHEAVYVNPSVSAKNGTNGYVSTNMLRASDDSSVSAKSNVATKIADTASSLVNKAVSMTGTVSPSAKTSRSVGSVAASQPVSSPVYYDAPFAERYGMDSATAYQEALASSSHQREVADLKAAGLNPVLSANGGSGASVFDGSVYAPANSSSGFSRSSGLDSNAVGNIVGGIVGLVSPRLGNSATKLAKGLVQASSGKSLSNVFDKVL